MKTNKILTKKVKRDNLTRAAGPRRPLRKPPARPRPSAPPTKPATKKPVQPSRPTKPTNK